MCTQRSLLLRVACPARYAMQRPPVFHYGKMYDISKSNTMDLRHQMGSNAAAAFGC